MGVRVEDGLGFQRLPTLMTKPCESEQLSGASGSLGLRA